MSRYSLSRSQSSWCLCFFVMTGRASVSRLFPYTTLFRANEFIRINISSIFVRIRDPFNSIAIEFESHRAHVSGLFEFNSIPFLSPSLPSLFKSIFRAYLFEFTVSSIPSLPSSFKPIFQLYLFEFAASSIPLLPSSDRKSVV